MRLAPWSFNEGTRGKWQAGATASAERLIGCWARSTTKVCCIQTFWLGSAADLAERNAIGVFPVGGW
jgi:hypothetical protein